MRVSQPSPGSLSMEEARRKVAEQWWGLSFEIIPGLRSEGQFAFEPVSICDVLQIPRDLSGLRALDVGAWDGPLTFELERRGAEAMALDIQDPARVGFDLARKIKGSKAVHYQGSVYQLPCDPLINFDLIVFRGVYYHLKHPILAFERLSAALKMGGYLYFEGEALLNYAEDMDGQPISVDVDALNASGAPFCLAYPNAYKQSSNWFIPNPVCLKGWLNVAGFEVESMGTWKEAGQRVFGVARKVREPEEVEHALF